MDDDILDGMEKEMAAKASSAGETPPGPDLELRVINDDDISPELRLVEHKSDLPASVVALKSGYELVANLLPMSGHKALGHWVMRYKVAEDDPSWGNYLAGATAFESAQAAQKSAELLINGLEQLPKIVQHAFFSAEKYIRADLHKVFATSGGDFVDKLQVIISTAADQGATKLQGAAAVLDKDLNRKIEERKSEGVDLWVRTAMNAAELALAKHKAVNFYFNMGGGIAIFVLGAVFGAYLVTHVF
ncbi:hypothetical protein HF923_07550 [Acidithiobacillus ferriphilus]|uniref:hypothetical protein n=1 Tax=Acidithiobacillus ferriphilus TaxID=1689834 RepID=UPI001C0724CF|nr:hypothetical protein [Acidithiobacillus ferriphilus]MBU2845676.1 hypothetical protein [Acidithiobacillus ferriphilus]MEB8476232.1 hypothetical protein [Acidithiobacillus ferriphilus]